MEIKATGSLIVSLYACQNLQARVWSAERMYTRTQTFVHAEFGAWYPRFNNWNMHKPWDRYKVDVLELFAKRLRGTKARVLWRAYGPTHFGGSTGMQLSRVTPC